MNCENIAEELNRILPITYHVGAVIDNSASVVTTFLDQHNDSLVVYIEKTQEGYILTDDGYIIEDNWMCGYDVLKEHRCLVQKMMKYYDVALEGNALKTTCVRADDLPYALSALVQAMCFIDSMHNLE